MSTTRSATELLDLPLARAAELVASGEVSPVELVDACSAGPRCQADSSSDGLGCAAGAAAHVLAVARLRVVVNGGAADHGAAVRVQLACLSGI
jgi:hypothetical protein